MSSQSIRKFPNEDLEPTDPSQDASHKNYFNEPKAFLTDPPLNEDDYQKNAKKK